MPTTSELGVSEPVTSLHSRRRELHVLHDDVARGHLGAGGLVGVGLAVDDAGVDVGGGVVPVDHVAARAVSDADLVDVELAWGSTPHGPARLPETSASRAACTSAAVRKARPETVGWLKASPCSAR